MIIKRFFLLLILFTPALFAALKPNAHRRKKQRQVLYARTKRAEDAQLLTRADEGFQKLLARIPHSHRLTEQQQNEIATIEKKIEDAKARLETDQITTKPERRRLSSYISHRKERIAEIKDTDEISAIELLDRLLSAQQKKAIEGYKKEIESLQAMPVAQEQQEKKRISACICRLNKKIKLIQASAILAVSHLLDVEMATESLDTFALSTEQKEVIKGLQDAITVQRALHANATDRLEKQAISSYICRLNKKIRRIKANALLAVPDINEASEASPAEEAKEIESNYKIIDDAVAAFNSVGHSLDF